MDQERQVCQALLEESSQSNRGLALSDKEGKVLWANPMMKRLLKRQKNKLFSLIGENSLPNHILTIKGPQIHQVNKDLILLRSIYPLQNGNFFITLEDISTRMKVEKAKKLFFANISHELRIPLTVLNGYIEILQNEKKRFKHERVDLKPYKRMQNQVRRLLTLVEQMLLLARLEWGAIREEETIVDMPDIIYSIYDEIHMRKNSEQKITLYLDDELFVRGYEEALREAVTNLIYNAIHHTPSGSKIVIRWHRIAKKGGDLAYFSVKDNGAGLGKENISRVLVPFYTGKSTENSSNKGEGTGLGLAIVTSALQKHGSKLIVKSSKNKGSMFSFYLKAYDKDGQQ